MTSELAALKIQLSEEINKQREMQKQVDEQKKLIDKQTKDF